MEVLDFGVRNAECGMRTKIQIQNSKSKLPKGFEFLGYHYGLDGLSLAGKTIDNFISKALRLYEQEPVQTRLERLGEYTKRWVRWTTSLLNINKLNLHTSGACAPIGSADFECGSGSAFIRCVFGFNV